MQEGFATTQQAETNTRQLAAAAGSASAAFGATGVSGNSVDAMLADFRRLEGENAFALSTNFNWKAQQVLDQAAGYRAEAQSRIASVAPQPVQTPSPFALALGMGSAVLGGFNDYYRMADPTTQASLRQGWMFKPLSLSGNY